jgi:hypothetical protein
MIKVEATAEVFWTALKALPRKEQQVVLRRVLQDKKLRNDMMDLALIEERRTEPSRPLLEVLAGLRRSPFNVKGLDTGISKDEILDAICESRERT